MLIWGIVMDAYDFVDDLQVVWPWFLKFCWSGDSRPSWLNCVLKMEFEEVLPYQDFALKIPQHAIYKLPDLLNEVQNQPGRVSAEHNMTD